MFKANRLMMSDGKTALLIYEVDNWKEDIAANDIENSGIMELKEEAIVPEEVVVNNTDNITKFDFGKRRPILQFFPTMDHYPHKYPLTIFDTSGKIFFNNQVRNKMSCASCKYYTNEENTIFIGRLIGECEWGNFHTLPFI